MQLRVALSPRTTARSRRCDEVDTVSSPEAIGDDPGEAMLLAHNGDAIAYRAVLQWSARWLHIYFEYHGAHFSRREIDAAVNETIAAVHAKRHTFEGKCAYSQWLEAIADYKAPLFLQSRSSGARTPAKLPRRSQQGVRA